MPSTCSGGCPHTPLPVHSFKPVPSHALTHSVVYTDLTRSFIQVNTAARLHPFSCSHWRPRSNAFTWLRPNTFAWLCLNIFECPHPFNCSGRCPCTPSLERLHTTSLIQSFRATPPHTLIQTTSNDLARSVVRTNALTCPQLFSHLGWHPRPNGFAQPTVLFFSFVAALCFDPRVHLHFAKFQSSQVACPHSSREHLEKSLGFLPPFQSFTYMAVGALVGASTHQTDPSFCPTHPSVALAHGVGDQVRDLPHI